MIDVEVLRLRRLRDSALRVRAIAAALETHRVSTLATGAARLAASAASCWRIARVITGTLRAHPYPSYHRGPSEWRGMFDRIGASVLAAVARYQGRSLQMLSGELRRVVRELDDARALTLSADLSDTFGRSQMQLRKLIHELEAAARSEGGIFAGSGHEPQIEARGCGHAGVRPDDLGAASHWPYLAF